MWVLRIQAWSSAEAHLTAEPVAVFIQTGSHYVAPTSWDLGFHYEDQSGLLLCVCVLFYIVV